MTNPSATSGNRASQLRAGTVTTVLYLSARSASRPFSAPAPRRGKDGVLSCPVTVGETHKAIPPGR